MPTRSRGLAVDDLVKFAVAGVILRPEVLLESLRKLDAADARETDRQAAGEGISKDQKQVEIEEQRLLDAYRTSVISPAQLAQQMEKLKARRSALELRKATAQQTSAIPPIEVAQAVSDYCAQAATNLANFTNEEWREFLRTVVEVVAFHGDHLSIRGRIPVGLPDAAPAVSFDSTVLRSPTCSRTEVAALRSFRARYDR